MEQRPELLPSRLSKAPEPAPEARSPPRPGCRVRSCAGSALRRRVAPRTTPLPGSPGRNDESTFPGAEGGRRRAIGGVADLQLTTHATAPMGRRWVKGPEGRHPGTPRSRLPPATSGSRQHQPSASGPSDSKQGQQLATPAPRARASRRCLRAHCPWLPPSGSTSVNSRPEIRFQGHDESPRRRPLKSNPRSTLDRV